MKLRPGLLVSIIAGAVLIPGLYLIVAGAASCFASCSDRALDWRASSGAWQWQAVTLAGLLALFFAVAALIYVFLDSSERRLRERVGLLLAVLSLLSLLVGLLLRFLL